MTGMEVFWFIKILLFIVRFIVFIITSSVKIVIFVIKIGWWILMLIPKSVSRVLAKKINQRETDG